MLIAFAQLSSFHCRCLNQQHTENVRQVVLDKWFPLTHASFVVMCMCIVALLILLCRYLMLYCCYYHDYSSDLWQRAIAGSHGGTPQATISCFAAFKFALKSWKYTEELNVQWIERIVNGYTKHMFMFDLGYHFCCCMRERRTMRGTSAKDYTCKDKWMGKLKSHRALSI